jgi:signal transduction histidine kinase
VRALRLALLPIGVGLGVAAEWATVDAGSVASAAGDFAVGCVLLAAGALAWERRPESRVGALMSATGLAWFLGTLFEPALFLHRGPLVHLLLSYPTGRLRTRPARVVVAAAYVDGAVEPLAQNDAVTLALSAAVVFTAARVFLRTSGPARTAGRPALAAALAYAAVLALGALDRFARGGSDVDAVLATYEAVIVAVTIVLLVDLLRGRWAEAVVTGLVVDLGDPDQSGSLRAKLAHALGDPSLVIGYRVHGTEALVDDAGRPVALPSSGSTRAATPIVERGETMAFLIHDEQLLADPQLVDSVAAAARFAMANAALQVEARARAAELRASRRRIVEAADAQRRRLEHELRTGAERRLEAVGTLLARARSADENDGGAIDELQRELGETRSELREFAHGVHPAALTDDGALAAVLLLARRSPVPVVVSGELPRLSSALEAAVYFVCSEALANIAKHAAASRVWIDLRADRDRVSVSVRDDGVGGAAPSRGSGLRGLIDRVEAFGGRLVVESAPGTGTRLVAEIPVANARGSQR